MSASRADATIEVEEQSEDDRKRGISAEVGVSPSMIIATMSQEAEELCCDGESFATASGRCSKAPAATFATDPVKPALRL